LRDFSRWLQDDLGKRPSKLTWRLGKELYDQKFKLVMESDTTPELLLQEAESEMNFVRREMLALCESMHRQMYPAHGDHPEVRGREWENTIIGEVIAKISEDHAKRDQLQQAIESDLDNIKQFIRDKKIVSLGPRDNLKVIPTPPFMR